MKKNYQKRWLDKLNAIIDTHLDDPTFSQNDLSRKMKESTANLYRKVKELTTYSPKRYIRYRKLKKAKELLATSTSNLKLKEVAQRVGYNRKDYFIELFIQTYQKHPAEYIQ